MLQARVIPCLQLIERSLVKTVQFGKYTYIGDPCNTVRIFNELEVDELCFLDIRASVEKRMPNIDILKEIADECFMPLSYGGGVKDFETARKIFAIGFEKIVLNTEAWRNISLVRSIADHFGVQAMVCSIDAKLHKGRYSVFVNDGTERVDVDVVEYAQMLEQNGAGEILLTSIDREGTWTGFDLALIKMVASAVSIPIIANGGAGNITDIGNAVHIGGASAVGLGSMVLYQKKGMGVLVNFPDEEKLKSIL
jgi:imidazole glycerol-phosphate synthase subunit HisF